MASNKFTIELEESDRRLINRLCSVLEGNNAKRESGTTGCSAGRMPGLVDENRSVQPAGNPDGDWIEGFEAWLNKDVAHWKKSAEDGAIAKHEAWQAVAWVQRKYFEHKRQGAARPGWPTQPAG